MRLLWLLDPSLLLTQKITLPHSWKISLQEQLTKGELEAVTQWGKFRVGLFWRGERNTGDIFKGKDVGLGTWQKMVFSTRGGELRVSPRKLREWLFFNFLIARCGEAKHGRQAIIYSMTLSARNACPMPTPPPVCQRDKDGKDIPDLVSKQGPWRQRVLDLCGEVRESVSRAGGKILGLRLR